MRRGGGWGIASRTSAAVLWFVIDCSTPRMRYLWGTRRGVSAPWRARLACEEPRRRYGLIRGNQEAIDETHGRLQHLRSSSWRLIRGNQEAIDETHGWLQHLRSSSWRLISDGSGAFSTPCSSTSRRLSSTARYIFFWSYVSSTQTIICEVIRGHQRSSDVIRGSSEVIRGHQRLIRGHQRSSEAIRGSTPIITSSSGASVPESTSPFWRRSKYGRSFSRSSST